MEIVRFDGDLDIVEKGEASLYLPLPPMTVNFDGYVWGRGVSRESLIDDVLETVQKYGGNEEVLLEAVIEDGETDSILRKANDILFTHIALGNRFHLLAQKYNQALVTGLDISQSIVADAALYADYTGLNNVGELVFHR